MTDQALLECFELLRHGDMDAFEQLYTALNRPPVHGDPPHG